MSQPTFIEYEKARFLIHDSPSDKTLHSYMKEFEKHNVTDIARLTEPNYSIEPLEKAGIRVHDMPFSDGEPPPPEIVARWLALCEEKFKIPDSKCTIGVHCVAGLGRAPVLVAIALVEQGMSPLDSVAFIRSRRRGAINSKQLKYIEDYKPRKKKCIIQ